MIVNGTFPSDARGAAKLYLEQGRMPVPVPYRTKQPVLKEWQKFTTTSDLVDASFSESDGIGLLLGDRSGNLVDIDLDCEQAVTIARQLLPATGWVSGRQGNPRSHYWYIVDDLPKNVIKPYQDPAHENKKIVELRAAGQTIVAPSRHKETGEEVRWEVFDEPAHISFAELKRVVDVVAAATLVARCWPRGKANRHDLAMFIAGGLLRGGMSVEDTRTFFTAFLSATNDTEIRDRIKTVETTAERLATDEHVKGFPSLAQCWGEQVVAKIMSWLNCGNSGNSGNHKEKNKWADFIPFTSVPDTEEFPIEVFPKPIQKLSQEISWTMNCPIDFPGVSILTLAGGALANSRHISISRTHSQSSCLNTAIVGHPGTTKSHPLSLLSKPFDEAQEIYLDHWQDEIEEWEGTDEENRGPRPTVRRCICSDTTTESLCMLLSENDRGLMMIRGELAELATSMNQYKGGRGQDRQFYLKLWDGQTIINDRKSDKSRKGAPLFIRNPFSSIIGTIQPDVLDVLQNDGLGHQPRNDGFFDRFLFCYPKELPDRGEEWREVSEESLQIWKDCVHALLKMTMVSEEGKRPRPYYVPLSATGRKAWEEFTTQHARERNAQDFPIYLLGPWSKLKTYCARIALIIHYLRMQCDEVSEEKIDGESVYRAWKLIDYFKSNVRKIHAYIGSDPRVREARRIYRWVRDEKLTQFTKRECYQKFKGTLKTVDELDSVLKVCERHYLIRQDDSQGKSGPGRKPSPVFEVNPNIEAETHSPDKNLYTHSHNSHNSQNRETPPENTDFGGTTATSHKNISTGSHNSHYSHNCREVSSEGSSGSNCGNCGNCGNGFRDFETDTSVFVGKAVGPSNPPINSDSDDIPTIPQNSHNYPDTFVLVQSTAELPAVTAAVDESDLIGLDLETTGLDPRQHRIRLLSLHTDRGTWLIDCFQVDPSPLFELLAEKTLIGHNLVFDLQFLMHLGFQPGPVSDTMLLSRLIHGTRQVPKFHSLAKCAERELGEILDKSEQKSEWSAPDLTPEQLRYAARDVDILPQLHEVLTNQIRETGQERVAAIEMQCLPTMAWMGLRGVGFDSTAWKDLANEAEQEVSRLVDEMEKLAPQCPNPSLIDSGWNWSSPQQVVEIFGALDIKIESAGDEVLATIDHPLADLLRKHRHATKRSSTYGIDWLKHARSDGRVYAGWQQIGADSGRMACKKPNLQQLPRDQRYRECFRAPEGRVFVVADYSQIELRIAAQIANESNMKTAYEQGEDLHTRTARMLLGKDDVTKADRQLAKSANFGLLYGMGARGYHAYAKNNYGVDMTLEQATEYRKAFFDAYPALRKWHGKTGRTQDNAIETRTLTGRRRANVSRFTEKLNTPVQGTGADGLKQALALMWERRDEVPGAFPVLVVHDEIVIECDEDQAEQVKVWLETAMKDGMQPLIDPVPVEVEAKVSKTWTK